MIESSHQFWSSTGRILIGLFDFCVGIAASLLGGSVAHDAIRYNDHGPALWIAMLTCLLGIYALATVLSLWNDSRPVYWGIGIAIVIAGLGAMWAVYAAWSSVGEESRRATGLVGFPMAGGLILTGITMIWWNEKHATIYCRYRMHLGGVILNALVAAGIIWIFANWEPRGHMDMGDTILVIFLALQIVWQILLLIAIRRFPRQPKATEGTTTCYRT